MSTQVRERVSRIEARSTRVTRLPLGLNAGEAIAALLAIVLLVWLVAAYSTSLRPQQERLRALETELAEQQRSILASSTPGTGDPRNPFGSRVMINAQPACRAVAAVTASSKSESNNCSAS